MAAKLEETNWRLEKGAMVPADAHALAWIKGQGFKIGDVVSVAMKKPRNPQFNGLAHKLGSLFVENIEAFHGKNGHEALKQIQLDAGIACSETVTDIPGFGRLISKKPRSLSYASMDQGTFYRVVLAMCEHVSETYWPSMTPERIARMADCWVEPT